MAVYTRFTDAELDVFLQNYAVGTVLNLKEIAQGVENSNYFLTTTTGKYVLTIYEKRVNIDDLPYFLSFSEYLNKQDIPTPSPVRNLNNQAFTDFKDKKAAIIHFLQGNNLTTPNLFQCVSAGEFVAKMHLAQAGFTMTRPNDLSPKGSLWTLYDTIKDLLKEKLPHFYPLIAKEVLYLQEYYPPNLPMGNIHADIFPDNMFFDNEEEDVVVGIIDFYFSCTDFLAYDLAIVVCAWCFDEKGFNQDKFNMVLHGYKLIKPLTKAEKQSFTILMRGAAMRFFLTRAYDFIFHDKNALVVPKNPQEYYDILVFLQNFEPKKI
jgi:homoserine kinase type II